jgi:hypothetical protein
MNLLPKTEKDNLKKGLKLRLLVMALFLLAVSFLIGVVTLLPSYFLASGNLSRIQLAEYSSGKKNENLKEETLNLPGQIDSRLKFFQSNIANLSVVDVFYKMISVAPAGIKLNSVSFSRDQIYKEKNGTLILVSGIAGTREALVSFSASLKKVEVFSSADVPVSSLTKDRNLPFSINIFVEN